MSSYGDSIMRHVERAGTGWGFWDETQTVFRYGYASREDAAKALRGYADAELEGGDRMGTDDARFYLSTPHMYGEITLPAGPRMGRFRVDAWLLDSLNPVVGAFLRTCYVVSAIPNERDDYVEYTAEHPDFRPCAVGPGAPKPPLYLPQAVRVPNLTVDLPSGDLVVEPIYQWVVGDPVEDSVKS